MQLTGVFLIFLTLPLFVVPWVERRVEVEPPSEVEMADHVVICGFSERGEALVRELDAQHVPYVIVESDRDIAHERFEDGEPVIFGNPEHTDVLENACVSDARAVVIDESDEHNATLALSVRELGDEVISDLGPEFRLQAATTSSSLEPTRISLGSMTLLVSDPQTRCTPQYYDSKHPDSWAAPSSSRIYLSTVGLHPVSHR